MIGLTADVHAAVEGPGNLRIHIDQEVLLFGELLVSISNLRLDPGAEWFADDGVGDVDEPLPRDLMHVTVFREVVIDQRDLPGLIKDPSDAKILVLWSVEDLDVVALDTTPIWLTNKDTYYFRLPVTRSFRK